MELTTMFKSFCTNMLVDKATLNNNSIIESMTDNETASSKEVCQMIVKNMKHVSDDIILGHDVFRDIEMFENIDESYIKTKTVFDVLDRHSTTGGKAVTKNMLLNPLYQVKTLEERQALLKNIEKKDIPIELLNRLKELEKDVLWLFEDIDQNLEDVYNMVFFRAHFLKNFNNFGSVLTGWNLYKIVLSPLIGVLSPIVYFIVPYFIIMYKFPQLKLTLTTYLKLTYQMLMNQDILFGDATKNYKSIRMLSYMFSLLFYFQGVFNSIEISKTLLKMATYLTNRINNVIDFLKLANNLIEMFWDDKILGNIIHHDVFLILSRCEERDYIEPLNVKEFSILNNFGENLKVYKNINREVLSSVLIKTYIIDSMISIVKFRKDYELCYTDYIPGNKMPWIKVDGLWHICLDKETVVKNDLELEEPRNAIITGPNAGGKSTCVKSFLINILLSQSLCISTSLSCSMTPLYYISSQISIPDCKGHESLFQAELYRCKNNMDVLKSLKSNQFAFIIMDEIFNSTNVIEGISGAYAIAKKLSNFENLLMIFTTHFSYLTKLAKDTRKFVNFKMNVEIHPTTKDISFPYKISRGISKQYIALELLKQKGFDEDILEEALIIKARLGS